MRGGRLSGGKHPEWAHCPWNAPRKAVYVIVRGVWEQQRRNGHGPTENVSSRSILGILSHCGAHALTRSAADQRQTINTMFNRAKHHPQKTDDIKAAQAVFEKWLKETYPKAKSEQRVFKPVLAKKTMEAVLPLLKQAEGVDTAFAEMYVELEPRKRLANTLVDESQPGEADWDKARTTALSELVPEGGDDISEEKLRGEDGKPSVYHLSLIAWAWSPTTEYKLLKAVRE